MSSSREPYKLNVLDQSPVFQFAPHASNDTSDGWKVFYEESPDSTYDLDHVSNNLGRGTSLHSSRAAGASATIEFVGTACTLYGGAADGAFTTTLDEGDERAGAPNGTTLVEYSDLDYGKHSLTLTVSGDSAVNVTSVDIVLGLGEKGSSTNQTNIDAVEVSNGGMDTKQDSFFSTSGAQFSTDHDATGYSRLDTNGLGTISFSFTNASIIQVLGTMNYDHGQYSVSMSPSAGVSDSTRTFNASSFWFAYDSILFFESDLDRTETYQITMKNLDQGLYMDVHQVILMDAIPTDSAGDDDKSGLSTGAIAGIAVGAAVAVLAAILALYFLRRRRNQRANPSFDMDAPGYSMQQHGLFTLSPYDAVPTPASTDFNPSSLYGTTTPGKHSRNDTISSFPLTRTNSGALDVPPSTSGISTSSASDSGRMKRRMPELRVSPAPLQELDAGPLPEAEPEAPEVLPPGYNPAWAGPSTSSIPNTR